MIGESGDDSTFIEAGRMENLTTLKSGLSEVCMLSSVPRNSYTTSFIFLKEIFEFLFKFLFH